jgi:hypothetical protein
MLEPTLGRNWLRMLRRYLLASAIGNFAWEVVQFPLYTLWHTGTACEITQMVLHCTAADVLIALVAVVAALLTVGSPSWPEQRFLAVMLGTVAVSVVTTIAVEYLSTIVWQFWAYTEAMPTLPWLGTGVSPVAQWVVLPPLALVWARRR